MQAQHKALIASGLFDHWRRGSIQERFTKCLHSLWQATGRRPQMGLAISGGVDSMALASLCSTARRMDDTLPSFTGFIVDHGLRTGSGDEANSVARELEILNIKPSVLTLDRAWQHSSDRRHVETTARTLRYQALGRACRARGMCGLLVGHHADDQAETILQRLILKYYGNGLAGMQPLTRIPECSGIHGVDASGEPKLLTSGKGGNSKAVLIEDGGVMLGRPLLMLSKHELKSLCQERSVPWVEDATNHDTKYALRNTVRYLQAKGHLPKALGTSRLCELARSKRFAAQERQATANQLLLDTELELDFRISRLRFKAPQLSELDHHTQQSALNVQVAYVKQLCDLVGSTSKSSVDGSIHDAVDVIFSKKPSYSHDLVNVAGLRLQRLSTEEFILKRNPPSERNAARNTLHLDWRKCEVDHEAIRGRTREQSVWKSDWHLWDERYWIQISCCGHEKPAHEYHVQTLTKDHIRRVRVECAKANDKPWKTSPASRSMTSTSTSFEKALHAAPGDLRFTLPVILRREGEDQAVVALPTLGWSIPGFRSVHEDDNGTQGVVTWEIRHRWLGLEASDKHEFKT